MNSKRPPHIAEQKVDSRKPDINRERFVFVLTNLVGRKVQAKLRNNITYEGLFHGSTVDGDYSITLKCAREIMTESRKSGEVIQTLIIPGKDFLQMTALEIPAAGSEPELAAENMAFAVDGEISGKKGGQERELVAWAPAEDGNGSGLEQGASGSGGLEGGGGNAAGFDQFAVNEERYGVTSTYREELYTTKLDPTTIPKGKREEAERIAREIESGRSYAEVEGQIDGENDGFDEEQKFSAAALPPPGPKAWVAPSAKKRLQGNNANGQNQPLPMIPQRGGELALAGSGGYPDPVPLTSENLGQHETALQAQGGGDSAFRDHRGADRGLMAAQASKQSSMISDMKGINALNLEAALPKLDDKMRNDWINFKQSQTRNNSGKPGAGSGLKKEFEQSLADIKKRQEAKQAASRGETPTSGLQGGAGGKGKGGQMIQGSGSAAAAAAPNQRGSGNQAGSGDTPTGRKPFAFNPQAKGFSLNPSASVFTPGGAVPGGNAGGGAGMAPAGNTGLWRPPGSEIQGQGTAPGVGPGQQVPGAMAGAPKASAPQPGFAPFKEADANLLKQSLPDLLTGFYTKSCSERPEGVPPTWENAVKDVSFKDALGVPNPSLPIPMMPMPQGGMPGPWQQQQQGPGQMPANPAAGGPAGGQPQMMQQGFGIPAPGGGMQMYQQMFPAGAVPMQQAPMGQGNPQQQPQPGMAFGQQAMGQGNPQMGMAQGGMVQGAQGNPAIAMGVAAPKFPGQVQAVPVMIPAGGYPPQGFMPQAGGQGATNPQQGGANPQQGQMMQPQMYTQ